MVLFPTLQSTRIFWCYEGLIKPLEVKLKKRWGSSNHWYPLEFFSLWLAHNDLQQLLNNCSGFCILALVSTEASALGFLLLHVVILCIHMSLQFWGQYFALWSHFSGGSKKSWFFNVFSFFFVVRTKWWLPISLEGRPETRHFFPFLWLLYGLPTSTVKNFKKYFIYDLNYFNLWGLFQIPTWPNCPRWRTFLIFSLKENCWLSNLQLTNLYYNYHFENSCVSILWPPLGIPWAVTKAEHLFIYFLLICISCLSNCLFLLEC